MWIKDNFGQWRYTPADASAQLPVPGDGLKVYEKDASAVVFVPVQTVDDAYREHRLFKHLRYPAQQQAAPTGGGGGNTPPVVVVPQHNIVQPPNNIGVVVPDSPDSPDPDPGPSTPTIPVDEPDPVVVVSTYLDLPDKAGFWLEAWASKAAAIRDYFPNLALVDVATSSELVFVKPTHRRPVDFVADFSKLGYNYVVDGVRVAKKQRVLVKDQWYEDLDTYPLTRRPGFRSVSLYGSIAYLKQYLVPGNLASLYDASGAVVQTTRVLSLSSGGANTIVYLNDVVADAAVSIADPVAGNWARTELFSQNNVYMYDGNKLVSEEDLVTREGCYHYTVWSTGGKTTVNKQFFLERNGAREIAAAIEAGETDPTRYPYQDGYGYYPYPTQPKVFSPGSAQVVSHRFAYDITLNAEAVRLDRPQPRVLLATLDQGVATHVGYQNTYERRFQINNSFDVATAIQFFTRDAENALVRALRNRFCPKTPTWNPMRMTLFTRKSSGGTGGVTNVKTDEITLPANTPALEGNLVQLRFSKAASDDLALDETFCLYRLNHSDGTSARYAITPALAPEIVELGNDPDASATFTLINAYRDRAQFVENVNGSFIGDFYRFEDDTYFSIPVTVCNEMARPEDAYASRDMQILFTDQGVSNDEIDNPFTSLNISARSYAYGAYFNPHYGFTYNLNALLADAFAWKGETFSELAQLPTATRRTYSYDNLSDSTSRVGLSQDGYLTFGSNYLQDPGVAYDSALVYYAGMQLRLQDALNVYVLTSKRVSTVRDGVAYDEYVLKVTSGGGLSGVIPSQGQPFTVQVVGTGPDSGGYLSNPLYTMRTRTNQAQGAYRLPQRGYAYMFAKARMPLSGILFTDEDRDLRVLFNIAAQPADADVRLSLTPVESMRLGVEHKVTAGIVLDAGPDWSLSGDRLTLSPKDTKSRRIRFTDGLTEENIIYNVNGQGKYAWILREDVVAVGAIVGCTGGDGTGALVWYAGQWLGGTWEDGVWYSGVWKGGTWKAGTWCAYLVSYSPSAVQVNRTVTKASYSVWEDGTWLGGSWIAGTWLGGKWVAGAWYGGPRIDTI